MTTAGVGREELRRTNVRVLLNHVHLNGPTNRADLTGALGLNRSTIGDLADQLQALGLVQELHPESDERRGRRAGRPSLVVAPRADVAVLAIALDVDRISVALVALGGSVLDRSVRTHQRGEHDMGDVVNALVSQSHELLALHPEVRVLGVGVSVPGRVRVRDGFVRFAPNLGWLDEPFAEHLSSALGLTVRVDNDATLGMLAEWLRGAARGAADAAFVSGSVGIGGGILSGGRILRGAEGYAGEVGHLLVDTSGAECRCGAVGCWETRVGENQLLTGAGRLPGGGPAAVQETIAAAGSGDSRASASLADVATWTGVGLRHVVTAFNPEVVVLGGVLAAVWSERPDLVLESLDSGSRLPMRNDVRIVAAALGADSSLLGAAELGFEAVLEDPVGFVEAGVAHGAGLAMS